MVSGTPASNTTWAAWGSAWMLNSAAGVTLPSPIAPPMVTISRTLARIAGFLTMASATLVSGPSVASVIGSVAAASVSTR